MNRPGDWRMSQMIRRVAVIPPLAKQDYLVNTVLDGLEVLQQSGVIDAFALADGYPVPPRLSPPVLEQPAFHDFARTADAVLLLWGKKKPNWKLAEQLGCWAKTAFVDGSEPGGDLRFDARVQRAVLEGAKRTEGAVNFDMLRRCAAYFRREKPILPGMEALPFGIDRHHLAAYRPGTRKDIDFFCVFGQDKHPLLRREATAYLRGFCAREGFNCVTDKVAPDRFYELLARSKVGVSVGGGGYDTARFWEILGNNCLLLTERIDLLPPRGTTLAFERIHEFGNLYDFADLLPRIGRHLRESYDQSALDTEHRSILDQHSSAARARQILTGLAARIDQR